MSNLSIRVATIFLASALTSGCGIFNSHVPNEQDADNKAESAIQTDLTNAKSASGDASLRPILLNILINKQLECNMQATDKQIDGTNETLILGIGAGVVSVVTGGLTAAGIIASAAVGGVTSGTTGITAIITAFKGSEAQVSGSGADAAIKSAYAQFVYGDPNADPETTAIPAVFSTASVQTLPNSLDQACNAYLASGSGTSQPGSPQPAPTSPQGTSPQPASQQPAPAQSNPPGH